MAIVWVFILGFIMLGLIAGDSNRKTAKERAYLASIKLSRHCEEYLSVWLTFFAYAFLELDEHKDPYGDARKDVAVRCRPGAYLYLSEDFWPPINDHTSTMAKLKYCHSMGPRRRDWNLIADSPRRDWLHVPDKNVLYTDICKLEKQYDELVDLYDWWFRHNDRRILSDEDNASSDREKKLRKAIKDLEFAITEQQIKAKEYYQNELQKIEDQKKKPANNADFILDNYFYLGRDPVQRHYQKLEFADQHGKYRKNPKALSEEFSAKNVNGAQHASLFDLQEYIPDRVKRHYPEMEKNLEEFWKENDINPVSILPEQDLLGRSL